eukprot:1136157-Pelagomonas_calceolata.AAC.4
MLGLAVVLLLFTKSYPCNSHPCLTNIHAPRQSCFCPVLARVASAQHWWPDLCSTRSTYLHFLAVHAQQGKGLSTATKVGIVIWKRAENVKALEAERLEFEARAELTGVLARHANMLHHYKRGLPCSLADDAQKERKDAEAEGMPEEELGHEPCLPDRNLTTLRCSSISVLVSDHLTGLKCSTLGPCIIPEEGVHDALRPGLLPCKYPAYLWDVRRLRMIVVTPLRLQERECYKRPGVKL